MTLTLGSINLLKQPREFQETFYLQYHSFIIRGYNSTVTEWMRHRGQVTGKGHRASIPSPDTPLSLYVFTKLEAL